MKNFISKTAIYSILLLGLTTACDNLTDTYDEYIGEGEITYIGTPNSVLIGHGYNKLRFDVVVNADPKITKGIVKTNDESVYHEFSVVRNTNGQQTVTFDLDVPEGDYTFEVYLMDANNNSSVKKEISSRVYGERYQANLTDRHIISSSLSSNLSLIIDFATMDLTTGAYATEVVYTDKFDVKHTVTVPVTTKQIVIADYKIGSQFKQRSLFLPTKTAIDTFYTPFVSQEPQVIDLTYMIKNNKRPFVASSFSGRWGTLADWTTNDVCKNHSGYGGVDFGCCGNPVATINLESGWGAAIITNGKIHQTITLEAGTYIFNASLLASGSGINSGYTLADYVYLAVAKGNTLPDSSGGTLETNPATLGFKRIVKTMSADSAVITFTLTQPTEISLGISTTQGNERYGHFLSFSLVKKNK